MGRKYTRDEINSQIEEAKKDMPAFYRAECVNYSGTTSRANGNEYYTEIISEYLLENYDLFDQIKPIKRENYKIDSHDGTTPRAISNRKEERIALALYGKNINSIGKIIDYQVPLKSKHNDDAGKIDLMAFDEKTGVLRLIELKAPKANDTLLRCVLEIFTYRKTVDKDALIKSYDRELKGKCKEIRICALFFKDSKQDKEYEEFSDRLCQYNQLMENRGQKDRNCLFFIELMNRISAGTAKVELLRFPFADVELVSAKKLGASKVTNTVGCPSAFPSAVHTGSVFPVNPIVMMPIFEQPNGFPFELEKIEHPEIEPEMNWDIEILDY